MIDASKSNYKSLNSTILGHPFNHDNKFNNSHIDFAKMTFRQKDRIEQSIEKNKKILSSTHNQFDDILNKTLLPKLNGGYGGSVHGSISNLSDIHKANKTVGHLNNSLHNSMHHSMVASDINGGNTSRASLFRSHSNSMNSMTSDKNKSYLKPLVKESQFLNSTQIEKIELKNENVKELYHDVNRHGPNFQYCEKCNYKNLEYFKELRPENAIKLLTFIKEYRKEHSYKK